MVASYPFSLFGGLLTGNDGSGFMVEGQTFTIGESFTLKMHVFSEIGLL